MTPTLPETLLNTVNRLVEENKKARSPLPPVLAKSSKPETEGPIPRGQSARTGYAPRRPASGFIMSLMICRGSSLGLPTIGAAPGRASTGSVGLSGNRRSSPDTTVGLEGRDTIIRHVGVEGHSPLRRRSISADGIWCLSSTQACSRLCGGARLASGVLSSLYLESNPTRSEATSPHLVIFPRPITGSVSASRPVASLSPSTMRLSASSSQNLSSGLGKPPVLASAERAAMANAGRLANAAAGRAVPAADELVTLAAAGRAALAATELATLTALRSALDIANYPQNWFCPEVKRKITLLRFPRSNSFLGKCRRRRR